MTISITVLVMETTGAMQLLLPLMFTIFSAKVLLGDYIPEERTSHRPSNPINKGERTNHARDGRRALGDYSPYKRTACSRYEIDMPYIVARYL